jgi:hypothetical protein
MAMNPALRPDASLPDVLRARARAASDGRLILDVAAGSLASIAIAAWRPTGWMSVLGVSIALAAFGLWGILDRELRDRPRVPSSALVRTLLIARIGAASVGVSAAILALFAALGLALGTWIS